MRGNATLRVPSMSGSRYEATACITGTANRNIIVVPCIVKIWLYRSRPTRPVSGRAVCSRLRAGEVGTFDRMAHRAAGGLEHLQPALRLRVGRRLRGLALRLGPGVELLGRLGDHEQAHQRVLQAAELGALAAVDACAIGAEL